MFTGSKDRACDRESREDRGKRKRRNHSGSRRDKQRGQRRYDGYSEEIPGSTQEDETSESWPDHSVRDSTRDRKQEPRIQELEEDVDQQPSTAAMQGRGRGIRGFMEQLCGEGGDVYEGWTASERKGSWSVCRRLETGSRQWIGQRTLFKLVGQGGLANQAESGQDYRSSNIRQGNAGLKCVSLNARSVMNKKSELNIMVNDSDPHIIGITESWANKDITDAELGLEGYVMFRKDRMGKGGGGVLLYVKDTIPAYEIQLREEADCEEAIWCKLVTGHKTVTMGVVYRCPNITAHAKPHTTIRSILVAPKDKDNPQDKCGVVYQLTCHDCEASYIGETERALKQRLKEHHKDSSPVGHHMGYNNHELDSQNIRIVDRDSRWFQRGVREAIEIRSRSPTLNRDRGRHNLPSVYNTIVRSRDTRMAAAVSRDPNQS